MGRRDAHPFPPRALSALALALVACDDGHYELVVHVPGDAAYADAVEVSVLRSCLEIAIPGQEPDAPIRTIRASAGGSEPIGWLAEGSYGLYGRAWDHECLLYAAGCSPATIESGESGTLDVFLQALTPRGGCDDGQDCRAGRCVAGDGGLERDADSDTDAGTEADGGGGAGCDGPLPRVVGAIDTPGTAVDVAVDGALAFVADGEEGLRVIDVSDPTSPLELGAVDTADDAQGVAVANTHAYVADSWDGGLVVVDVADPAAPAIVGSLDTSGDPRDVAIQGAFAFVADANWDIAVIDVATPMSPVLVARADLESSASSIVVAGSYAFVGSGTLLHAVSIEDPREPYQVSYALGGAYDIALWADRAFTTAGEYGIRVVDVSDPASRMTSVDLDTPGNALGVAAADGVVLVADGAAGLQILDVTNPDAPVIAAAVDTPGTATSVAIGGPIAFVADGSSGLVVIDLGCFAE